MAFRFGLVVHVDDCLYSECAAEFRRFESELQDSFSVGPISVGNLTITGLRLNYSDNPSGLLTAFVDQDHFLEAIEKNVVPADRAAGTAAAVTTLGLTLCRQAVGELLRASGQTQPFMACTSSMLD